MADMSFFMAVTCSTLFFWLSVDLINLVPHLESVIRNCKKKLRNINNQLTLILKLYGDLLPVSLLGAFSHAVLGIRDSSDHL